MSDHPLEGFPGYRMPGYTQIPDQLLDEQLHLLTHAELKVLLYIMRHTFGYKRDGDHLSARQIAEGLRRKDGTVIDHGTGCEVATVRRTVKRLEALGLITVRRERTEDGDAEVNFYGVRIAEGGGVATTPRWCRQDTTGVVSPGHPQYTGSVVYKRQGQETPSLSPPDSLENGALTGAFFATLGVRKPSAKARERAARIITDLTAEGFTAEALQEAFRLAADRGARGPDLLPYLVGEAQAIVERRKARQARAQAPTQAAEDRHREDLARVDRLTPAERGELEAQARATLGIDRDRNGATVEAVVQGWIAARLRGT